MFTLWGSDVQVCLIHGEVGRASELVDEKLKKVDGTKSQDTEKKELAQKQYDDWVIGWTEENGKQPTPEERYGS